VGKELEAISQHRAFEQRELAALFEHEGFTSEDAVRIVTMLVRYPESYHRTMVEKELGIQLEPSTVKVPEALTMGVSYIVGSIFPLAPYIFVPVRTALPISIAFTIIALIVVGIIKGN